MTSLLTVGQQAPDFALPNQDGVECRLSSYRGSWVLIYFYPRDNTPGCTQQACGIRDSFPDFSKSKVTVLGISTDSVGSHKKFAERYTLPFNLLADTEKEVVRAYGVWAPKKFMGREFLGVQRTSFLIDPAGVIAKIYEGVKPTLHAQEVLRDMEAHV